MEKVRYSDLLPWEFRQRLAARPVAYLPLGTLEWHGEHLPLGSDAIQSEELMIECAKRFGGIVMPPIHLGPDRAWDRGEGEVLHGMDYADSTDPHRQLDGSCYWVCGRVFRNASRCDLRRRSSAQVSSSCSPTDTGRAAGLGAKLWPSGSSASASSWRELRMK